MPGKGGLKRLCRKKLARSQILGAQNPTLTRWSNTGERCSGMATIPQNRKHKALKGPWLLSYMMGESPANHGSCVSKP